VFRVLIDRGVAGVEMRAADEHVGLVQALKRYFPHAAHQRCTVHYLRNVLAHVSSTAWKQDVRVPTVQHRTNSDSVMSANFRVNRQVS
jgi:transposase-like protein